LCRCFNEVALEIFGHQARTNIIYKNYISYLGIDINTVKKYTDIPFLPIQFFKTQHILEENMLPQITFTSSGTTGMVNSQHHVPDLDWYEQSFRKT